MDPAQSQRRSFIVLYMLVLMYRVFDFIPFSLQILQGRRSVQTVQRGLRPLYVGCLLRLMREQQVPCSGIHH